MPAGAIQVVEALDRDRQSSPRTGQADADRRQHDHGRRQEGQRGDQAGEEQHTDHSGDNEVVEDDMPDVACAVGPS